MIKAQLWYTRRGDDIRGPFNIGLIQRYVLLGRLRETDEVSIDKQEWWPIAQVPELIPQVMRADTEDPFARERLLAAKRWADERLSRDRRQEGMAEATEAAHERRAGSERRDDEPETEIHYRRKRLQRTPSSQRKGLQLFGLVLALSLAALFITLILTGRPPEPAADADCTAPPAPGVNWSNCRLEGIELTGVDLGAANLSNADLSGADLAGSNLAGADLSFAALSIADLRNVDLRRAVLKGAGLRNANLSGADLRQADLSYANLRGAVLDGAQLQDAILVNAIWVDNTVCGAGSIGECRAAEKRPMPKLPR